MAKRSAAVPSLSGAVDTTPLVTSLISTTVQTSVIRGFWRGDRFFCTDLHGDGTAIVAVDLDGRATNLATLTGECRFLDPVGPHVVAGVQWGSRSNETEVWLVPADRSAPRLLMRGDPAVATPDIILPPVANPDGTVIALWVNDGEQRSRVRVVDDHGAQIAELGEGQVGVSLDRWEGDDLIVSEYDYPIEAVRLRAWNPRTRAFRDARERCSPYELEETARGTYEITNASTGQVHELVPARKRERDLLARYRWKHGPRRQDERYLVIALGDTFLVDCGTGRSWTILPGEQRVFLAEEQSAIAVVSRRSSLLMARLDDRWRSELAPPADGDRDALIRALGSD